MFWRFWDCIGLLGSVLACVVLRCGVSVWIAAKYIGLAFGAAWVCFGSVLAFISV